MCSRSLCNNMNLNSRRNLRHGCQHTNNSSSPETPVTSCSQPFIMLRATQIASLQAPESDNNAEGCLHPCVGTGSPWLGSSDSGIEEKMSEELLAQDLH